MLAFIQSANSNMKDDKSQQNTADSEKKASLQQKLGLQQKFNVIQQKMDALEDKYQTRSLSTKIWPPNAIENGAQRSKANLLYAFLMVSFIIWTTNEFMSRIVSSIRKPIFESIFEKESYKFPVVTICGSNFMTRNHSFVDEGGHGCTFYDHVDPKNSLNCTSKFVEDLYWGSVLADYNPPCIVYNYEAKEKTIPDAEIGLDVWVKGYFGNSESDDDLWKDLSTYSVFLSETDLDNPKQKNPGYWVTNTMAEGFTGYRVSKAVNTGSKSVYSATLHSQVPGGTSLEILFDVDDDVQYLKRADPWADSYLVFGSMIGMFSAVGILYRLVNENLLYRKIPTSNNESTETLASDEMKKKAENPECGDAETSSLSIKTAQDHDTIGSEKM